MSNRFGGGRSQTLVFNRGSHLKWAQLLATAPDVAINDAGAFSKYFAEINRMSITPTSTLLRPGRIPRGVEQFRGFPGPFTVSGSFTMDAVARRMEVPFRQWLNAPTSGITYSAPPVAAKTPILAVTALPTQGTPLTGMSTTFPSPRTAGSAGTGPVRVEVTVSAGTISAAEPLVLVVVGEDVNGNELTR